MAAKPPYFTGPRCLSIPVERFTEETAQVVRDVAALERDMFLVFGRCTEQIEEAVAARRDWKSSRPFTINTGTFTRGMKLAGWVSGGIL